MFSYEKKQKTKQNQKSLNLWKLYFSASFTSVDTKQ